MPDRLRLSLGLTSLAVVLGSGVVMTVFTLKQSEAQVSQAELAQLVETVNGLAAQPTIALPELIPSPDLSLSRAAVGGERIRINQATATELDQLPDIGPVRAAALIEARAAGPFQDLDDIRARVPKIPASVLGDIAPLITFD